MLIVPLKFSNNIIYPYTFLNLVNTLPLSKLKTYLKLLRVSHFPSLCCMCYDSIFRRSIMKYRYAMVCSSNQNRSMEAHSLFKRQGFDVSSYGTGSHVKLPGPSLREPNVYDFGTPYKQMFDDLRRKDPELYKRNGILPMLKRNIGVKSAPQRWQENAADGSFDVVLAFEEKVFDMVIEDLFNRDQALMKSVLIINLEVKDNHEEAAIGARLALELCQEVDAAESWEDSIDEIVINFENKHCRKVLYNISFY